MDNEIRINKYISMSGYCSRRAADALVEEGRVTVDGGIATAGTKVVVPGLKTFAVNLVHNASQKGETVRAEDLGASFIKAVTDLLVSHTMEAAKDTDSKTIVLAGGVSANSRLRRVMQEQCDKNGIKLFMPELKYCGDNAAMIASQGYYEYLDGKKADLTLNAVASMPIDFNS